MHQVRIEKFEGPLSLLLDLIEQEKLEITEVSLAQVAEQYLQAIETSAEQIATSELADFLLVAAKLLLLKSRALLPQLTLGQDEDESSLAGQLRIYKIYRQASRNLSKIIAAGNFAFYKKPVKFSLEPEFAPPPGLGSGHLAEKFTKIIEALSASLLVLVKKKIGPVVSLAERISQLRRILAVARPVEFSEFLRSARNKAELIVSFLALLELIKQKQIFVEERNRDIYVFAS